MNVSIVGGSGFVGTRLIHLLKEDSRYTLKNIDLQSSHFFGDITSIGDVRQQEQMDQLLAGSDVVVLLAAQHRDDVSPVSLYYDTNVEGMRVTLQAMERNGIHRLVFFSSVAVYGLNKQNPDESHPRDPFNHYGKSKLQAEQVLEKWQQTHPSWNINIIRPTVIFGERNRGNVYNLLKQIASGRFLMVGKGTNYKSMAYVGNVVAFTKFMIEERTSGYHVFNYVDTPDMNMNDLVSHVGQVLGHRAPSFHIPYFLGMLGGYCFDVFAKLLQRKLAISSVRVKKFCATTQIDANRAKASGFQPPYTLAEGLSRTLEFEFLHPQENEITFTTV